MSLVFESAAFKADPAAAGTHALVVGVGTYPFLTGGASADPNSRYGLRQLTSSPASARAVADWLLAKGPYAGQPNAGLNNPAAPLATVDLLLADGVAGSDVPDSARLQAALKEWIVRCNANAANVAFLYVCGHGLKLRDLVVLASDFGDPAEEAFNAWAAAVSLDSIRLGMRKCKAQSQFLFFDCCRSYPSLFSDAGASGVQIFDGILDHADTRNYVAMYSTLEGSQAFGKQNEPSYFTRALLDAFNGFGAERRAGGWKVTNRMIAKALHDIMRFDVGASANLQIVGGESPGDAVLHVLVQAPKVKMRVQCQPAQHMPDVEFSLARMAEVYQHSGANGPFRNDVSPGEWQIAMQHTPGVFPTKQDAPVVVPPSYDMIFELP